MPAICCMQRRVSACVTHISGVGTCLLHVFGGSFSAWEPRAGKGGMFSGLVLLLVLAGSCGRHDGALMASRRQSQQGLSAAIAGVWSLTRADICLELDSCRYPSHGSFEDLMFLCGNEESRIYNRLQEPVICVEGHLSRQ